MKRLGYKKSRDGCAQCRKRRVKCDESRPCAACRRHSLPCSLDTTSNSSPSSDNHTFAIHNIMTNMSEKESSGSIHPSAPTRQDQSQEYNQITASRDINVTPEEIHYFTKFSHDSPVGVAMEITDLELMHHYTHVSHRISFFTDAHDALQSDVPREAFAHPHLLHQILAFSGFHLAYLRPDRRNIYWLRASQHQAKAIGGIRAALQDSITSQNCHSLYAGSVFLIISAFSTLPSFELYNPHFLPMDGLIDIFNLISGMSLVLHVSQHELRQGPLKSLFTKSEGHHSTFPCLDVVFWHLQNLKDRLERDLSLTPSDNRYTIAMSGLTSFIDAITEVQRRGTFPATARLKLIFLWPIRLGNDYIELLRQEFPLALVVLAHYCALLHLAENDCWFIRGWAEAIMAVISQREDLDSVMIEWPKSVLSQTKEAFA